MKFLKKFKKLLKKTEKFDNMFELEKDLDLIKSQTDTINVLLTKANDRGLITDTVLKLNNQSRIWASNYQQFKDICKAYVKKAQLEVIELKEKINLLEKQLNAKNNDIKQLNEKIKQLNKDTGWS